MSSLLLRPVDIVRVRPTPRDQGGELPGGRGQGDITRVVLGRRGPPGHEDSPALEEEEVRKRIAFLILSGRLEVEGREGFVSGVRAYREVVEQAPGRNPRGHTGRLSVQGLRFGQALATRDGRSLTRHLYGFNTLPGSPRCLRRLDRDCRLLRLLGSDSGPGYREHGWVRTRSRGSQRGWISWQATTTPPLSSRPGPALKLYVSPRPRDLAEATEICLPILAESGAAALKIGSTPSMILRPDKLVAHFFRWDEVRAAAKRLISALGGMEAQGVPFAASMDDAGLLGWGMDPWAPTPRSGKRKRQSWRRWVTGVLAGALRTVPLHHPDPEPWEYALTCLSLQGIEDETFAPSQGWRAQHSG